MQSTLYAVAKLFVDDAFSLTPDPKILQDKYLTLFKGSIVSDDRKRGALQLVAAVYLAYPISMQSILSILKSKIYLWNPMISVLEKRM